MRTSTRPIALTALLISTGVLMSLGGRLAAYPAPKAAPTPVRDTAPTNKLSAPMPASNPAGEARRAEIKALDEKIKSLREQFKSQADPLEAQVKALRERFESDLKPLQDQRTQLIEEGESPDLRSLNEQEISQIADLDAKEKAEIEKVRQSYDEQKKQLRESFQQKRHDLLAPKK
jgi:septal ring factor EnvC (AmiA/AmiB activator)